MMVRDMHIRKFQKENLDDLFAVIREKPSGLACLKRFADEQLMGGDVGFFIDVEGKSQEGQTLPLLAGLSCGGCHLYVYTCLLYTSPSPRDATLSRMPSSA